MALISRVKRLPLPAASGPQAAIHRKREVNPDVAALVIFLLSVFLLVGLMIWLAGLGVGGSPLHWILMQ